MVHTSPPERDLDWSDQGVEGAFRFINRVWRMVTGNLEKIKDIPPYAGGEPVPDDNLRNLRRKTHQTIKKVREDIEDRFHFNTAISAIMELVNTIYQLDIENKKEHLVLSVLREAIETVIILLSPVAPHICEELWERLGGIESIIKCPLPSYSEEIIREDEILIVAQINGKLRSRISVSASSSEDEIKKAALNAPRVKELLRDSEMKRIIYIPGKLVNIVTK
ncbi:MAG: leucyl-tRNA synthetase [bacterium]|nr:MAG: leucyl-tRNA synthetase [bacterium]